MRFSSRLVLGAYFLSITVLCLSVSLRSQEPNSNSAIDVASLPEAVLPEAPTPQTTTTEPPSSARAQTSTNGTTNAATASEQSTDSNNPPKHKPPPQPKRILGIMPNYRAVSAGVIPPPPTPREAFMVATRNSFDYSSFVFVGVTSLLAEGTDAHTQLGKGVGGYWAYYWRGYLDKTDGNYWVDWAMPTVFHQDERYYAMGEGNVFKRGIYAATRVLITPDYHGKNSFNGSEILGRGISQAISLSYYPSQTRTVGGFTEKYAYAIGRDALTNVFREVWPDINEHLFHRHH